MDDGGLRVKLPGRRKPGPPAILILAWASAPLAFAALSWARNSAGSGTRARRAHGSPPGPRADTSLARVRRRRRPASRQDGLRPRGSPLASEFRAPSRPPAGTRRVAGGGSARRAPRRRGHGAATHRAAPGRAFYARAPVHPPERPPGLRRPPRPSPRRPPQSPQPPPLGAPRSASQRGGKSS